MASNPGLRFLHSLSHSLPSKKARVERRKNRQKYETIARIELLEDRIAPAVFLWDGVRDSDGAALSSHWSDGSNWVGDTAPTAGATLVFPDGVAAERRSTVNDFPDDTPFAILVSGTGYSLAGARLDLQANTLQVTADGTTLAAPLRLLADLPLDSTTGTLTVSGPVDLHGHTLTLDAPGETDLQGTISGAGSLIKSGYGTAVLAAANSYTGSTTVTAGTLVVRDPAALSTADGTDVTGTAVSGGGALQLDGSFTVAGERLTLTDSAVLQATGNATWAGPLVLAGNGQKQFSAPDGSTLRVNNLTAAAGSASSLYVYGGGTVELAGTADLGVTNNSSSVSAGTTLRVDGSLTLNSYYTTSIYGTLEVATGGSLTANANSYYYYSSGASGLLVNGGTVRVAAGGTLTATGPSTYYYGNYGLLMYSGTVEVAAGGTLTATGTNGYYGGGYGLLMYSGSVRVAAGGTLAATNTGTGTGTSAVYVSNGTLEVDGSLSASSPGYTGPAVQMYSSTLAGSGSITTTGGGAINASNGTISPGQGAGVAGTLATGSIALQAGTFAADLNGGAAGSGYDQLRVTGSVSLGGAVLQVGLGYLPAIGTTFTLIDNDGTDPVAGTFANLPEGALTVAGGDVFQIHYAGGDGNDVTLTRINAAIWDGVPDSGGAALSSHWSDGSNWVGDTAPTAGATLVFPDGVAAERRSTINDFPDDTPFAILVSGTGYSLAGARLDLQANTLQVTADGTTLAAPLRLLADLPLDSTTGTLTVSGPVDLHGHTLTLDAPGETDLQGTISGAGSLVKSGYGTAVLAAANSYTGSTTVTAGTLVVRDPAALGTADGTDATGTAVSGGGALQLDGSFTVAGERLVLTDSAALQATGNATWAGPLVLAGNGQKQFSAPDGSTLRVNNLTAAVGSASSLYVYGGGTVELAGTADLGATNNSSSVSAGTTLRVDGSLTLNSYYTTSIYGTLEVATGGSLAANANYYSYYGGGSGLVVNGGTVRVAAGGTLTTTGPSSYYGSYGLLMYSGTVEVAAGGTLNAAGTNGYYSGYYGLLVNSGTVRVAAGGTLNATSTNTGTGTGAPAVYVNSGTLEVDGSLSASSPGYTGPAVQMYSSTLAGSGSITTTGGGAINASNGTISPGQGAGVAGTLATGSIALQAGTFAADLNGGTAGSGYDQLRVTGSVSLGGAVLQVGLGYLPAIGTTFTLIDNDGTDAVAGTFANLPEGALTVAGGDVFQIHYAGGDGNDVTLTRINAAIWDGVPDSGGAALSSHWSDGSNWVGDTAPTAGATLVFPDGVAAERRSTVNDFPDDTPFAILVSGTGYSLAGARLDLQANTLQVTADGTTLAAPLRLLADLPLDSTTGTLTVTGSVDLHGHTLTLDAPGETDLQGTISGAGSLIKSGYGTAVLAAANSYTGSTTVTAGTLVVRDPAALGTADGTDATGTAVSGGGALQLDGSFTVAGERLVLTDSAALQATGNATWAGPLVLAGNGQKQFSAPDGSTLRVNNLTAAAGSASSLYVYGGGTVELAGTADLGVANNSSSVSAGTTLRVDGSLTLSSSYTTSIYGTLEVATGGSLTANANSYYYYSSGASGLLVNGGTVRVAAGGTLTATGPSTYYGNYGLLMYSGTVEVAAGGTLTATGTNGYYGGGYGLLMYSGSVRVAAGGTLAAANTGTGTGASAVYVSNGTLEVDGSLSASSPGYTGPAVQMYYSTLAGSGSITTTGGGAINVSYGTVSPGQGAGVAGTLATGSIALQAGTFAADLNGGAAGSGYDQLRVTGSVSLGGAVLQVGLGYLPAIGTTFILIDNDGTDPVAGTFANLPEGALITQSGGTFRVHYAGGDGNDVTLTLLDVNHAPELMPAAPSLGSTDEDTSSTIALSSIINHGAGTTTISDTDANTVLGGIALTGTTGRGTWYYSLDGSSFSLVGGVSDGQALLLGAAAQLRYQPDAVSGETATITYRAWDKSSGGAGTKVDATRNGIASPFSSVTDTASLAVTDVNDAPAIASGATTTLASTDEDTTSATTLVSSILSATGYTDVDPGAVAGIAVTATSGSGSWQFSTDGTAWLEFGPVSGSSALLLASTTQVRYVPDGRNGEIATFTFEAWDQTTGTAGQLANPTPNGGASAFSTEAATAQMVVTSLNDAPTLSGSNSFSTITEDQTANGGDSISTLIAGKVGDVDSNAAQGIAVTTVSVTGTGTGTWQYSLDGGGSWSDLGSVSDTGALLLRPSDRLRLVPDGQNGTTGSVTFRAWDQTSGTAEARVDTTTNGGTTAFSTETAASNIAVTNVNDAPVVSAGGDVALNEGETFSRSSSFTDPDIGDSWTATVDYGDGSDEQPLALDNKGFSLSHLYADNGTFTVLVTVTDSQGASGSASLTVAVANVAPTLTVSGDASVNEGAIYTLGLASSDPGADTIAGWSINWGDDSPAQPISGNPSLVTHVYADGPNSFTISATATDEDGTYNSNSQSVSILNVAPTPTITGAPATSPEGTTITLGSTVTDPGTLDTQSYLWNVTKNGSAYGSNSTSSSFSFTPDDDGTYVVSLAVTDKDAGVGTDSRTITVTNVAPTTTNDAYVTTEDTALTIAAPGVLANDNDIAADLPFLTAVLDSGPAHGTLTLGADGSFTYTPNANYNGADEFTYRASDGSDTSTVATVAITVNPVNDSPDFTKGANQTVLEDAATVVAANWASDISAGPADEASQTLSFLVTNTNNALFSAQPAIDPAGTLSFTPAPNANGTATITVALHDSGGTANGGIDTSATQTFTITITPVNDAPAFVKGADQTVLEDAGPQAVTGWATSLSTGPADEASQTLSFLVTNTNNALFSAQPAIDPAGTLSFTPAPNANGTATITVALHDSGGTANGGADTSAPVTFTITVTPVNDAPSFVKGPGQVVFEDAGAVAVPGWATSLSAGPANEASQTLNFVVTGNTNPSLFSAAPAIDSAGKLTYTPTANANGTATITVALHDNGGTANGGADTSPPQSFTITVTPVNDAPSFVKGNNPTVLEDAGPQAVDGWATSISAGPADEVSQTLNFVVTGNTNPSLFSAAPAIDSAGKLTYTPTANANGTATITVALHDNGGTANGGIDTSATQTFTITVTAVADAPTLAVTTASGNEAAAIPLDITAALTDTDGSETLSIVIAGVPASASLSAGTNNGDGSWTLSPGQLSGLTITPADSGSFNLTVLATSAEASNGSTATTTRTLSVSVANVAPTPIFTSPVPATSPEGTAISLTGSATDPSTVDTAAGLALAWSVTKDGNAYGSGGTGANFSFTPDDNGSFIVTLTATDKDGGHSSVSSTIAVTNVAPTPTITGAPATSPEGTTISLGSTVADPGTLDTQTYLWSVTKNGSAYGSNGTATSYNFTPDDNGSFIVTLTATDKDGGHSSVSSTIAVTNVAPTLTLSGNSSVNESATYTLGLASSDPGADTISGWSITWGDGSPVQAVTGNPSSVTHIYADGPSSFTISATATDEDGTYNSNSQSVSILNVAPTPIFTSPVPTTSPEGTAISLTGSATDPSTTDTAAGLALAWSVTKNGNAYGSGGSGGSFSFTPDDNGTYVVSLTATDKDGGTATDTRTITVNNVAPVITNLSSSSTGGNTVEGNAVLVTGLFTDAGTADTHTAVIDWGDGTSGPVPVMNHGFGGSHVYTGGGVYTITVTVTDDDGGSTVRTTQSVVAGAAVKGRVLTIVGTNHDDDVTVNTQGSGTSEQTQVHANFLPGGSETFDSSQFDSIVILLGEGNDQATVAGNITKPVLMDGGRGDDHLNGGGGSNILLGGAGDDVLIGGLARDLLIGGAGRDSLVGNSADDILIGGATLYDGTTDYDLDVTALQAIMDEWNKSSATDTYLARTTKIRTGILLGSRTIQLVAANISDDQAADVLVGSAGQDWFFLGTNGTAPGRDSDESNG